MIDFPSRLPVPPLFPLRNGLDVLNTSKDAAVDAEIREMMDRQLSHMVRLIDDLLDVSRISSDKLILRKERISLRAVVETAVEASRPAVLAEGHTLTLVLPEEPVWLDADPTRLAQVISNLLTNAAKYTPEGGAIELAAVREGREAVVRVKDTGLGIPPRMLTQVFEMFTQVNRTLHRSQGGLGIGLALVKRLVELHGGTITAESPGLGEGSAFTVRMPLVEPRAGGPAPRTTRETDSAQSPAPACRVLVVDDNIDGALSLAKLLQIRGHETRTAHSGPETLDEARRFKPDVVFLDIGLPGMNGYEVAKRMKSDPLMSEAVLIAITGWGDENNKRQSREAGFELPPNQACRSRRHREHSRASRRRRGLASRNHSWVSWIMLDWIMIFIISIDSIDTLPRDVQDGMLARFCVASILEGGSELLGEFELFVELADRDQAGVAGEGRRRDLDLNGSLWEKSESQLLDSL